MAIVADLWLLRPSYWTLQKLVPLQKCSPHRGPTTRPLIIRPVSLCQLLQHWLHWAQLPVKVSYSGPVQRRIVNYCSWNWHFSNTNTIRWANRVMRTIIATLLDCPQPTSTSVFHYLFFFTIKCTIICSGILSFFIWTRYTRPLIKHWSKVKVHTKHYMSVYCIISPIDLSGQKIFFKEK